MSKLYSLRPGLKKARKKAQLTQQQLADKFNVSVKTVMNWEQGLVTPDLENVIKLADLLHADIDFLTGRIDCRTHDLQFVHDLTGLSEDAITILKNWHQSGEASVESWPFLLNKILEDDDAPNLMNNLNIYAGTTKLSKCDFDENGHCPGTNDAIKDKNIACLWQVSRIFSNIVERLFG